MTNLKEEANIFQDAWMNSEVATVEVRYNHEIHLKDLGNSS